MCKNKVEVPAQDASAGAAPVPAATTRTGKSQARLRAATTALLDARGPEKITITDIVAAAHLTRPTFYATYGDLPTAFADAALHRLADAFEDPAITPAPSPATAAAMANDMSRVLLSIITRLEDHSKFFQRTLRGPGGHRVMAEIIAFVSHRLSTHSVVARALQEGPLPATQVATAFAAGTSWLTWEWINTEPHVPAAQFADQLRDFILRSVFGGLAGKTGSEDAHQAAQGAEAPATPTDPPAEPPAASPTAGASAPAAASTTPPKSSPRTDRSAA